MKIIENEQNQLRDYIIQWYEMVSGRCKIKVRINSFLLIILVCLSVKICYNKSNNYIYV